jgi:hypothetical protein
VCRWLADSSITRDGAWESCWRANPELALRSIFRCASGTLKMQGRGATEHRKDAPDLKPGVQR